jgi:hypothetical protein
MLKHTPFLRTSPTLALSSLACRCTARHRPHPTTAELAQLDFFVRPGTAAARRSLSDGPERDRRRYMAPGLSVATGGYYLR